MSYIKILDILKQKGYQADLELVNDARNWAGELHVNKRYGNKSYLVGHLDEVVLILAENITYKELYIKYIIAGYLHDSLEDTDITYNDIKKRFGVTVAELVFAVTNGDGRNRAERQISPFIKMCKMPESVQLKLADRIANIKGAKLSDMYVKEFKHFKDSLKNINTISKMWNILEDLVLQNTPTKPFNPEEGD